MSLFKERQASSKKLVALQNEIISLKLQLSQTKTSSKDCQDCSTLKSEIADLKELLELSQKELSEIQSDHKAELKKLKSEITRLKKKIPEEG